MNPKKMQSMMKQMGISQEEIPSLKVTIEKIDGGKIIINNPHVVKIKMQGQENFQISGDVSEEKEETISEDDVKIVMQKTNCSEDDAKKTLEETGDLAEAILKLSK